MSFCGERKVSTIDHFLAKTKFPSLAVSPINLVPACQDCNKIKGDKSFKSIEEQVLHPYFDNIDSEEWLVAKIIKGSEGTIIFEIRCPENGDEILYKRIKKHFDDFKLNVLYSSHAAEELASNFMIFETIYKAAGKNGLKAHLDLIYKSKKSFISEVVTGKVKVVKTSNTYELVERKKEDMKDSGVEWLGEIPREWDIKKIKYVASLKSGESITSNNIRDDDKYPVYGGNGLRGYTDRFTHKGKYILIGRQGALCGNINYTKDEFWASEHAVVVNPILKVDTLWLGELLRIMNLNQYSISAAQPGLAVGIIENLSVPFIEYNEQIVISDFINKKILEIKSTSEKTKQQIEKLKEAKQSLISEAVTGKIEIL